MFLAVIVDLNSICTIPPIAVIPANDTLNVESVGEYVKAKTLHMC